MKDSYKGALSLIAIIVSAYVAITLPISEGIPFTAQSLVIFIVAGLLRPRLYFLVIISYLLLGSVGAPVFAEGSSGWEKIKGGSGGFLYGFLFSGWVISQLSHSGSTNLVRILVIMMVGTVVLFTFGVGHLTVKFGFEKALDYGFHPFWKMGLVKAALAGIVVYGVRQWAPRGPIQT